MEKEKQKLLFSLIKLQIYISSLIILISILAAIFNFESLEKTCVCILNYLAYSWILYGITIIIGVFALLQIVLSKDKIQNILLKILILLQAISFISAFVLFVIFASLLLDIL